MSGLDKFLGVKSVSDLTKQVADGFTETKYLKDYAHASKLMRSNNLALAPKQKFLFHVFFNLTYPRLLKSEDKGLVGALVKSIQLPSFHLDTQEYIQYNRKRLVHNRIKYQPVTMKLHDDGEGHVLDLWNQYYNYYFADSRYDYDAGLVVNNPGVRVNYNARDIYQRPIINNVWGKTIETPDANGTKPAFFKDITIYGFNRGRFIAYILINPVIVSWSHDNYDYSATNGTMEHNVQIQYEAVKYVDSSAVVDTEKENVKGFGDKSRYDTEPGALGPGSTKSIAGPGGLAETFSAIGTDLAQGNIAGAVQKLGAGAKTFGSVENLVETVTTETREILSSGVLEQFSAPTSALHFPVGGENVAKKIFRPKGS